MNADHKQVRQFKQTTMKTASRRKKRERNVIMSTHLFLLSDMLKAMTNSMNRNALYFKNISTVEYIIMIQMNM